MKLGFIKKAVQKVFLLALIFPAVLGAQSVDEEEIRSIGADAVQFVNYTGPYDRIDSLESIRAIGGDMGTVISRTTAAPAQTGSRNKYYIIHAIGPEDTKKRDADILILGPDAGVDNIVNVRRIISAYLSSAYGYDRADADTLAIFTTVYNAVYRGKIDIFRDRYKDVVLQNLTAESCGISLSYREWPGQTQIVIPLYNVARGGLSTVDTSVISDSRVVESMREENDRNLDARQQMVDLKEREADEAADRAQAAQQLAVATQQEANDERNNATQAQQDATNAQRDAQQQAQEAADAQQNAQQNPEDKTAQQLADEAQRRADEAQARADEAQRRADEAQARADEAQKRADEARQTAANEQAEADKFQTEAQNDRTEIAKDVQDVMKEQMNNTDANSVYGLQLVDEERNLSTIVQANSKTGSLVRKSPVSFIRNKTIYGTDNGYIAIAGEKIGNGAIRLVTIDTETLTISQTGDENVAEDSVLVQIGTDFYCVIDDAGKYVVACYGADVKMKMKSTVAVKSSTPISDTGKGVLMVTDANGNICLLNTADLKAITQ